MPDETILLILTNPQLKERLEGEILEPAGFEVASVMDCTQAEDYLKENHPGLIIMDEQINNGEGRDFTSDLFERFPTMPILMIGEEEAKNSIIMASNYGSVEYLIPPFQSNEVLESIRRGLGHRERLEAWKLDEIRRDTDELHHRVSVLETLGEIGRSVTASLDLDEVLTKVVEAAVRITEAEEGSILLLDEDSDELYIRAALNFQEEFVRTFRMPVEDSLAGEVIRSGRPVQIDEETPKKIKTAYFVRSLIYVPLRIEDRVRGVLGVDNRKSTQTFTQDQVALLSALADYAAIAIENASLYRGTEIEKNKLRTILTRIKDGVIVVGQDRRIQLINRTARATFGLGNRSVESQLVEETFDHPALLELLKDWGRTYPYRSEITLENGQVLNAQLTAIPDVGIVVTIQDITQYKELDRIKSEFVNTVSHDLRSPLTSILGYIYLIEQAGSVNDQQSEYIQRVILSVQGITDLITDLLDLGRIESGLDARKEMIPLHTIVLLSVEGLKNQLDAKAQKVTLDIPDELPKVLGNPTQLRQMMDNLINNAHKYTPKGGRIHVSAQNATDQVIFQVTDNGPGIPHSDQPYVFDKFFRATNIDDMPGTGLGLAIVKSIVENHQGRVWVDSIPGEGSTFSVVLPVAEEYPEEVSVIG